GGPSIGKKLLPFPLEQKIPGAGLDEHAEDAPGFYKLRAAELLIGFDSGEGIDTIFRRDTAHRRQRIAIVEQAVENHSDDTIPQLSINRLTVVPFTIHPVFHRVSFSDIHNYITNARASVFLRFFYSPLQPRGCPSTTAARKIFASLAPKE